MPPKGTGPDVSELGQLEEKPKGSNQWRVRFRLVLDGKQQTAVGPLHVGPSARELAEADLRQARASASRAAMYDFVRQLSKSTDPPPSELGTVSYTHLPLPTHREV